MYTCLHATAIITRNLFFNYWNNEFSLLEEQNQSAGSCISCPLTTQLNSSDNINVIRVKSLYYQSAYSTNNGTTYNPVEHHSLHFP